MAQSGYHCSGLSAGSQSRSRDTGHGRSPLQVGSSFIVNEEQGEVKNGSSARPAEKQTGIVGRFSTVGCALWAVCVIVFFVLVWYRCGTDAFLRVTYPLWP